jgi:hypothetical protein
LNGSQSRHSRRAASGQKDRGNRTTEHRHELAASFDHVRYSFFLFERTVTGVTVLQSMLV